MTLPTSFLRVPPTIWRAELVRATPQLTEALAHQVASKARSRVNGSRETSRRGTRKERTDFSFSHSFQEVDQSLVRPRLRSEAMALRTLLMCSQTLSADLAAITTLYQPTGLNVQRNHQLSMKKNTRLLKITPVFFAKILLRIQRQKLFLSVFR